MSDFGGPGPTLDPPNHDPHSTSSGLLAAAVQRDPQAWEALVDQYSLLILGWCRQRRLKDEDAADVLQIVMFQVVRSLPNFKKDGRTASFRRWLRTITRTKISDYLRRIGGQPQSPGGSSAHERMRNVPDNLHMEDSDDADTNLSSGVLTRYEAVLKQVQAEVDERTWKSFWMTAIENLRSPEVAAILGMTENAVRLAKFRVLRRLRELGRQIGIEDL